MSKFLQDEFLIPVCIADLPAADFQVSPETLTEDVVAVLENIPDLPGVLIVEHRKLVGFITRLKLFERLGHRYGIELFMRKPISELSSLMRTQVEPLPGNMRVDNAVQRALARAPLDIYDPVVVKLRNNMYRILDMNVLVLAQSRTVTNLSNVVGKLGQIDALIYQDWDKAEILQLMLRLLGQVVPYHQAQVLVQHGQQIDLVAAHGCKSQPLDFSSIQYNSIYRMMLKHRQAIYLPDTSHVPAWQGMEALGQPASWLGVPLLGGEENFLGFLSLGRNVDSPFTLDEKQTCQAFTQRMAKTLLRKEKKSGLAKSDDFSMSLEMFALADTEGVY
jgi:hypothetical protein